MLIRGVTTEGRPAFEAVLRHGQPPDVAAWQAGFVAVRPLRADRVSDELVLTLQVRRTRRDDTPPERVRRGRDRDLVLGERDVAVPRQRVAAYAVVISDRGLLATQYSGKTAVGGRWGMPGGGVDDREQPTDTVLREVHEETAQTVVLGELVTVQSSHWVGRSPSRRVEDFHAVRLVYRAECPDPTDVRVLDADGTTADARWVPVGQWRSLTWTTGWQQLLAELLRGT